MKHIVSRMSSYFPNRWPLSYRNLTKNMKTYIRRQQHKKFKHQDIKQQQKKKPPQKYRLGTISNTKLLAGLNVITSRSLVEDADLFGLLNERSKIPDHSILLTEFRIHDTTCQSPPSSSATCSTKRYKLNAIPVDFLSSNISKLALQSVIQRIESARETQNEVDDIYSTLCKLLIAEMDANIPTFDTSKRTKNALKHETLLERRTCRFVAFNARQRKGIFAF